MRRKDEDKIKEYSDLNISYVRYILQRTHQIKNYSCAREKVYVLHLTLRTSLKNKNASVSSQKLSKQNNGFYV